jgi:hypothetical protein
MNLKHYSLLKTSGYVNMFLGLAIIIISLGEFLGIIQSNATNIIPSMGVSLSLLVFISGILCALAGGLTVFSPETNPKINLQVFAGVLTLGWPIFISVALLFAEHMICIRLLPTALTSLFYLIAVLIVKITNEAFKRTHQFNPHAIFNSMGKRRRGVNIQRSITKARPRTKSPAVSPLKRIFSNPSRRGFSLSDLLYGRPRRHRGRKRFR